MPNFGARLADGWHRATEDLQLALVPILLALTDFDKIRAVLEFSGGHVGFRLGAPMGVVTVWQFVSVPNEGASVNTGVPLEAMPSSLAAITVALVVQAALSAGYFGRCREVLDDSETGFVANVARYFVPFLLLTLVPFLLLAPFALGVGGAALAGGLASALGLLLFAVAVPAFVILAYLFYATPYLVVLRDVGFVSALRGSYALATEGGAYLRYFGGFAVFVLIVSPFATALVVNVPIVGLVAGIVGGGVIGLAANLATMRFVADIDPESPDFGEWGDGPDGGTGPAVDDDRWGTDGDWGRGDAGGPS